MPSQLPVVIIGSGFGGVALAIRLKRSGYDNIVILEKARDLGGVWRDNTYPGCACDVPSLYYSYSFETNYPWSSFHAPWNEIHAYVRHCARKYDVLRHIRFNVEVKKARFDKARAVWTISTKTGETIEAQILVSAVGIFGEPTLPDIPGIEKFSGPNFHSSSWNHDVDMAGKRIAAVGVGASAIQYVPEIAKTAGKLHVFQRTPQYVRARDEGVPPEERRWFHDTLLWKKRERQRLWSQFEDGFDMRAVPEQRISQEQAFLAYLEQAVPDPHLREKLTPKYPLGCKRVLASNSFYPAIQQPHVELVTDSIAEVTPTGLRTKDGRLREVDCIVWSTGFKPTEYLASLTIEGADGKTLRETWNGEPEAYMGTCVTGFPNFFMLYGPNTNGSGSIIYMLEAESEFITGCIEEMHRRHADTVQPSTVAQRAFNELMQERLALMPVSTPGCNSYFKTKTGKVATQWPMRMSEYDRRARNPVWSDLEFETVRVAREPAPAPVLEPAK